MPQKKNPDVPELARGKTGRVVGHLMGLLMLMKAQPLAYNKDNQEDKEPLFDTVDTVKDTLRIFAQMIAGEKDPITGTYSGGLSIHKEAMQNATLKGYATATDLADYLVKKGLPFRDAHETVALAVKHSMKEGKELSALSLDQLQSFHPSIQADVYGVLSLEGSLHSRTSLGGTAPDQVKSQILRHTLRLQKESACL
jgi:argininosuccinate lyase